eukprot:4575636-Prymnesium_polylepis.1
MQALANGVFKSGLALVFFALAAGVLACPLRKGRQQEARATLFLGSGGRHVMNPLKRGTAELVAPRVGLITALNAA